MARKEIKAIFNDGELNNINHNFEELYKGIGDVVGTITEETIKKIINTVKINWLDFVDVYEEIESTYPNPNEGDAVMAKSDSEGYPANDEDKRQGGTVWRFNGSKWDPIQSFDASAIVQAENRLDNKLSQHRNETNEKVEKVDKNINKLTEDNFFNQSFPWYFAHRGAKNIYQENTLLAYENCIKRGNRFIELDVQQTNDGALVVMHDDTMDRTTNGNWAIRGVSSNYISTKSIIDKVNGEHTQFGYAPQMIPFLVDVFTQFGRKTNYIIESKDRKSARKIVELAKQMRVQDYIMIQSFSLPDLEEIKDEGIKLMHLKNNATMTTFREMRQANIEYFGCNKSSTDDYIRTAVEEGFPPFVYTVNTRYERDRLLGLGVAGFFSDDPFYLAGSSGNRKSDTFREKVFTDGMISNHNEDRGRFNTSSLTPYTWGFPETNNTDDGRDFVLQGWAGELPDGFVVEIDFNYLGDYINGWATVVFCTPIDYFDDNKTDLSSGYHLSHTRAGNIILWKVDRGVATVLKEVRGEVERIEQPTTKRMRVTITPSHIRAESVTDDIVLTVEDSAFRNGYLHLGRRATAVTFSNCNID
ncbi:glycerophosphodiester phosphodiesterase [Oceanobacillus neutriphilus]|uniref:GP-PDE domain-containing protein n=1 Tax=Oceanobacillus neutriphilus TaxID=531815 RepID=A0ABQ2P3H5_9BACI|nr:glycerophosphodiester phosphodiesterase [Oceanobacillus neutriphilus]GGP17329.1 hypothetical protein GCM10011346_52720 [Oceanobacillus neutriphilus]